MSYRTYSAVLELTDDWVFEIEATYIPETKQPHGEIWPEDVEDLYVTLNDIDVTDKLTKEQVRDCKDAIFNAAYDEYEGSFHDC